MIKSILISFGIVLHLLILVWYYNHSSVWCATHVRTAYPIFYLTFICIAFNMFISTYGKKYFLLKHLIRIHSVFIAGLGLTYMLSYRGIIEIDNLAKLYYTLLFLLVIFSAIIWSAVTNKFFIEDTGKK